MRRRILFCGISQREVARQTGLDYRTVNHQCRRGIHTIRVAKRYARVLNCHPLYLLEM